MVEPRFVELLTKELTEELTLAERQELNLLLQQNAAYRKQTSAIKEYWNSDTGEYKTNTANFNKLMGVIRAKEGFAEPDVDNHAEPMADEPDGRYRFWQIIKYAATVLVFVSACYFLYSYERPTKGDLITADWEHSTTAPRVKRKLVLADSTIVTLNAGTTLSYPRSFKNSKTREVYLNGEAFFEVHKDKKHPFIIHTKKMNVRVLGTVFNIKSYDDAPQSETSLIEGSIEVTLNDRKADRIILKPKEKLVIENNLSSQPQINKPHDRTISDVIEGTQYSLTNLTYIPSIDSSAVETLWLKDKLVFKDENFESIARDMSRWYGIEIVFEQDALKSLVFSGAFKKTTTVVEALESMRLAQGFHFRKKGLTFYISN